MLLGECTLYDNDITANLDIFHFEMYDCGFTGEEAYAIKSLFAKLSLTGELSSFTWYVKMWLGLHSDPDTLELIKRLLYSNDSKTMYRKLKDVQERLNTLNFDLVVCDNFTPWCSVYAHDVLGLPYVNVVSGGFLGTRYSRWWNSPSPMSYVPEYMTHFTDSMTFLQRLKNLCVHLLSLLVYDVASLSNLDEIREMWGNRSSLSTLQIVGASSLFIINKDFIMEYPRPVQPNVVLCGGISVAEAKPLSQVNSIT